MGKTHLQGKARQRAQLLDYLIISGVKWCSYRDDDFLDECPKQIVQTKKFGETGFSELLTFSLFIESTCDASLNTYSKRGYCCFIQNISHTTTKIR